MGLLDAIKGQFIDVIEWLDDTNDTLAFRFERYGNEIKNGAKLIVRPGQEAIFVNEGNMADRFGPGTYELHTKNLPILTTLGAWKHGFNSPFKAEVYFFSTRQFTNMKWGTPAPVMLRDPELGPVRIRAFGNYAMRISNPPTLLKELISTDSRFETGEISEQLRAYVVQRLINWLSTSGVSVFDLAAKYGEIGVAMGTALRDSFAQYGLELTTVVIENVGLPPEVEAALDKRTQMGILGDLNRYTQFQVANAVEEGAGKGGGNPAMDLAVGVALGNQLMQNLGKPGAAPPPLPQAEWHAAIGGQQQGPFDAATLQVRIRSGDLTRDTLVWKQGMSGWIAAAEAPELQSLFAAVPPPLPEQ